LFHAPRRVRCGSDALSMRLEELQLALAEGPIGDALDAHEAVSPPT
jgi:hypothetical protein